MNRVAHVNAALAQMYRANGQVPPEHLRTPEDRDTRERDLPRGDRMGGSDVAGR